MIYPDLFRQRGGRFNQNLSDVRGTTNFSHWDRNLPLSKFSFFMKKENWSRIHHPGIHLWVSLTDSESKHVASDTERASVVCPHTLPSPPSQIMTPPPPHIAILRRHPPLPTHPHQYIAKLNSSVATNTFATNNTHTYELIWYPHSDTNYICTFMQWDDIFNWNENIRKKFSPLITDQNWSAKIYLGKCVMMAC